MTLREMASFSTTCWKYYSAVVGKILNIADGFFCRARLPDHDYRSGRVILI
jgi:hypothetical protein